MLKKITAILASSMIFISILSGCSKTSTAKDTYSEIKKKGTIVVGLDDQFPPMGFKDEKGEIVGFDIDLAKEAANRMGLKVEFKPVDWSGVTASLNNKEIDLSWNGLTITEKRKKEIDFTKAYLENKQIIIVKQDSTISTKSDLNGKLVGLQLGSSSEEAVNKEADLVKSFKELRKFPANTEALLAVKNATIDAVVVDEIVGRYYIAKKPGEYKILSEDFGREEYGIGIRKSDKTFLQDLDKTLDAMKSDGTADEISKRWFGEDIIKK
jgi:polar amino acid transport system substrate-binding protein